jgi:hypothetical protein
MLKSQVLNPKTSIQVGQPIIEKQFVFATPFGNPMLKFCVWS